MFSPSMDGNSSHGRDCRYSRRPRRFAGIAVYGITAAGLPATGFPRLAPAAAGFAPPANAIAGFAMADFTFAGFALTGLVVTGSDRLRHIQLCLRPANK
jgi:hypothetical protein